MAQHMWKRYARRLNRVATRIAEMGPQDLPPDEAADYEVVRKAAVAMQKKIKSVAEKFEPPTP